MGSWWGYYGSAGAAGGSGIRLRMRALCLGSLQRRSFTHLRLRRSAAHSSLGPSCYNCELHLKFAGNILWCGSGCWFSVHIHRRPTQPTLFVFTSVLGRRYRWLALTLPLSALRRWGQVTPPTKLIFPRKFYCSGITFCW